MIIGIIGAMDDEMNNLIDNLENKKISQHFKQNFYEANLNDHQIIATTCGIGKVNAAISTTLLINNYHPDLIINIGIAGGAIGLNTADILIAKEFNYSDFDTTIFGYQYGQVPGMPKTFSANETYIQIIKHALKEMDINYKEGLILTGDKFMQTKNDIVNAVDDIYGVEMEGCAIAHTCYRLNVDFVSIRIISDILDSENHIQNYNEFEKEAGKKASQITLKILETL